MIHQIVFFLILANHRLHKAQDELCDLARKTILLAMVHVA